MLSLLAGLRQEANEVSGQDVREVLAALNDLEEVLKVPNPETREVVKW
ncbi:hypothetical protein [Citricoccus sp. GCM10030269]